MDAKPTGAPVDLKAGIKARVRDLQQSADKTLTVNIEVIVPGAKGGEAAFLGPQVLDVTALDAAGRPLASSPAGSLAPEGDGPITQHWYLSLKPVGGDYARPARLSVRLAAAARLKTVTFDLSGLDLSNLRGTFRPEP